MILMSQSDNSFPNISKNKHVFIVAFINHGSPASRVDNINTKVLFGWWPTNGNISFSYSELDYQCCKK